MFEEPTRETFRNIFVKINRPGDGTIQAERSLEKITLGRIEDLRSDEYPERVGTVRTDIGRLKAGDLSPVDELLKKAFPSLYARAVDREIHRLETILPRFGKCIAQEDKVLDGRQREVALRKKVAESGLDSLTAEEREALRKLSTIYSEFFYDKYYHPNPASGRLRRTDGSHQ